MKKISSLKSHLFPAICLNLALFLIYTSCKLQPIISKSEFVLGTFCTVTLYENGNEKVLRDVFARLREIDNLFSVNLPSSDISRINAAAGIEPVQIQNEVFMLITSSLFISALTDDAFNPAIGPIVSLWNINSNKPQVPSRQEIEETLLLTDLADNFDLDFDTRTFFLIHSGMALDLGAIAKGYAADEAAQIIIEAGIKRAIIDLGGNIVVTGNNNNRPWRVGIQNPAGDRGDYIEIVEVEVEDKQMSIVTSGVYERYFYADGIHYHHIFSPFTGFPVDNELLSVTIITESSTWADALSTAVFVMGYAKGVSFLDSFFDDLFIPIKAIFVFKDGRIKYHESPE